MKNDTAHHKPERRCAAVLALLRGESVADISVRFGICRSDLYKFRRRALEAMRSALGDRARGPQRPANRVDPAQEARIKDLCERHPTWSSYQVHDTLGSGAPSVRTIQRVRQRLQLPRLSKRAIPRSPARRLSPEEKQRARAAIEHKPYLGPYRLAWDLGNDPAAPLHISPCTMKRLKRAITEEKNPPAPPVQWQFYERHHPHSLWHGDFLEKVTLTDLDRTAYQLTLLDDYSRGYVFCDLFLDPDTRTPITALITAMRQWQTIPKAIIFDNGSVFKGHLLVAFCANLGIRLIHTAVRHPQTNGKLERGFRDDMNEFYRQYDEWLLEPLRRDLPGYVHYRNYIRGHRALNGKPSITRLQEQHWIALPQVLDQLESYAHYEVTRQVIPPDGRLGLLGRRSYLDTALGGMEVSLCETLNGLEIRKDGQCLYVLREYRSLHRCYLSFRRAELPKTFSFEKYPETPCPRIAVAQ